MNDTYKWIEVAGRVLIRSQDELDRWETYRQIDYRTKPDSFPCYVKHTFASDWNTETEIIGAKDVLDMADAVGSAESKPKKSDRNIKRLVKAAVAYAEVADRHMCHEEWMTRTLQEAANLARAGDVAGAKRMQQQVNLKCTEVFDYTDVHKDMIKAVKPFRRKSRKETEDDRHR